MTTQQAGEEDESGAALDSLTFEKAELEERAGDHRCAVCDEALWSTYFEINGTPTCERCRYTVEQAESRESGFARFTRALAVGLVAAAVGAGIYYAVLALTGYEVGLIAIVVGVLVGGAVRWASQHRGGWPYQTLAVALTYVAIVSTYIPFLLVGLDEQVGTATVAEAPITEPAAADPGTRDVTSSETVDDIGFSEMGLVAQLAMGIILVGVALAMPFLAGLENILGLVIIFFALFQAWKMNKKLVLEIAGPFEIRRDAAQPSSAADGPLPTDA